MAAARDRPRPPDRPPADPARISVETVPVGAAWQAHHGAALSADAGLIAYLGGEGIAEPSRAACALSGTRFDCTLLATHGLPSCRVNGDSGRHYPKEALRRTGPARLTRTCLSDTVPPFLHPLHGDRTWRRGFRVGPDNRIRRF